MTASVVETLLKEQQISVLKERRAVDRHTFVRPLQIIPSRSGETVSGFCRDVSRHGISAIANASLNPGTIAVLRIHSLFGKPVEIRAEVRWCDPFGEGWFTTGWYFLDTP